MMPSWRPATVRWRAAAVLRRSAAALAAVLAAAGTAPLHGEEFFAVRDQNPLLRGFYLPLPSDSRQDDGAAVSATLLVSNTLNVERHARESLLVDGESSTLDLTYENALSQEWHYRFTLPIIHDSGGVLDSVIDGWHEVFGFSRGERPFYPKRQMDYFYSGRGTIDLNHAQTSVGDAAADVGWFAVDDPRRTLSVWGGLKAPSGSVTGLTSDGAWDGALWANAAVRLPKWQFAAELGLAQPFGDELFAGMAHRASVFGRFAASRALGSWSLRAQLDGQTGHVSGSDLRFLGPSLQLSVGAVRRLRGRWRVEAGFTEDAAVNTAPDITFFLGIHH
jgi:hypothetical protein